MQTQKPEQLVTQQQVNRQACGLIAGGSLILCIFVSLVGWLVGSAAPQIYPTFLTEIAAISAPTVTPLPTKTAMPTSTSLPGYIPHRIAVRVVDGVPEFYDRNSGETFVPRGHNYNRLSPIFGNSGQLWEETFNPGFYDPILAEEALQQMHADGYNIVRVIIDCCRPSTNAGNNRTGISTAYVTNVIDFLIKAKSNEIFVLLVLNLTPADGVYNQYWTGYPNYGGANLRYLTRGGFWGKALYDQDFIRALILRDAPLDIIFAYDLSNEIYYDLDVAPLDKTSGTITPVNGKTYDMSQSKDRQLMMDENMVYWIDEQRAAILEVDPTALVTASFMIFDAARPDAPIWHSTVDFVDIHLFMGSEWAPSSFKSYFPYANQGKSNGLFQKPIIAGKFAASKMGFESAAKAAGSLLEWQAISCQYGVVGWLLTDDFEFLYSPFSDEGIINNSLAPTNRPDPCLRP